MDRTIHTKDSHLCRSGSWCRDATYGHDTDDGWLPAATTAPNTLCDRCTAYLAAAVAGLWQDYLGLGQLVVEPSTGPTSEIRSPSPTPALPIDIHNDALQVELETVVGHAAAAITGSAPPPAFVTAVTLVENNLDALLRAPAHPVVMWNRAGDQRVQFIVDGIDIALKLGSLHRRARMVLGVDRGKDRMPVPCPKCEARRLVRFHGHDGVVCEACLAQWTDDGYRQLTMIGAQLFTTLGRRTTG